MKLSVHNGTFSVYRFESSAQIPQKLFAHNSFISITRTSEELSVVCETGLLPNHPYEEKGWSLLKLESPISFSMVGILASISLPLSVAKISIFVISTYDTDYIMVKNDKLDEACSVLTKEGFSIEN